jgi:DICT domain-containing protein
MPELTTAQIIAALHDLADELVRRANRAYERGDANRGNFLLEEAHRFRKLADDCEPGELVGKDKGDPC